MKISRKFRKIKRGSNFIFDSGQLMYCKCHKVNFRHGDSYIDYPDWIKKKKATINTENKDDDKFFQYVITVGLNYGTIESHPERFLKIKLFINKLSGKQ